MVCLNFAVRSDGANHKPATLKLLKDARSSNEHVPAILAGIEPPVLNESGYVTMGGSDEATYYVLEFGKAWKDTPGAIAWLIDQASKVASVQVLVRDLLYGPAIDPVWCTV